MTNGTEPVRQGDGQGGIYAVLIIIVILIVGAILYFAGVFGGRGQGDRDIDIRIETPDIGGNGAPEAPPGGGGGQATGTGAEPGATGSTATGG